jgi:hypothetical protein
LHVAFDAEAIAPSVETPIEVTEIVARLVVAIIAEFDAEPVKWTVMQTAEKTLHDVAGFKIKSFESREELGIEAGRK